MNRNYILLIVLITSLFIIAGCTGPGMFDRFYGRAIHTYTPPSTPELSHFPNQFLVDDDVNYILSFEDAIVASSSYDLSSFFNLLETKMCEIVTGAGYDCVDMQDNVLSTPTGSFFSSLITGGAIADNYADVVRLVACSRHYYGIRDDTVMHNNCASGWDYQGLLGFIYTVKKSNTVPLYLCYRAVRTDRVESATGDHTYHDHYLSTDVACEGSGINEGIIGYVYTSAQADTIPIHRCYMEPDDIQHGRWNHFVSNDADCPYADTGNWKLENTWHIINFCIDPDGGKNISIATTVEGVSSSKADSCFNANTVNEVYCTYLSASGFAEQQISCPSGAFCVAGACQRVINFSITKTIEFYNLSDQQVMYTIKVKNIGSPTSNTVVIRDMLPQGMIVDSSSMPFTIDAGTSALRWDVVSFGNQDSNQSEYDANAGVYSSEGIFIINLVVNISSTVASGTNLVNYVTATAEGKVFDGTVTLTVGTPPAPAPVTPTGGVIDDYTDVALLMHCKREYKGVKDHTVFLNNCPSGWDVPPAGLLGLIYTVEKPNTIPLYSCYRTKRTDSVYGISGTWTYHDHFVSTHPACEGAGINEGTIGYVYTTPQANSVPIYRCWQGADDIQHGRWNHFVTHDSSCRLYDQNWGLPEGTWYIFNPCDDSDDGGKDPFVAGVTRGVSSSVVDSCADSDTVREYYCSLPSLTGYAFEDMDCYGGAACFNGVCAGGAPFSGIGIVVISESDNTFGNLNLVSEPACPVGTSTIGGVYEFHWKDNQYGRKFNVCMSPAYQRGIIKTCSIHSDSSEGPWEYACDPGACPVGTFAFDGLIKTGMYAKPGLNTYTYVNKYARVCLPGIVGGKVLTHHTVNNNILDPVLFEGDSYSFVNNMVETAPAMDCPADTVEITGIISKPVLDLLYLKNNGAGNIYEFTYNKLCVALVNSCQNTIVDGSETDVDCGGSECDACANGNACLEDSDCESNNCVNNVCTAVAPAPFCGDGLLQTGEQCDPGIPGSACPLANQTCNAITCQCDWNLTPTTAYRISIPAVIPPAGLTLNNFNNFNTVLIGTCNDNSWVATVLGTAECNALTAGKALILLQHNPYRLIIAGDSPAGVMVALDVLNRASVFNLHGPRADITYTATSITVTFPHCFDGVQNFDETGVDCGGSCGACSYPPAAPGTPGAAGGGSGGSSWYYQSEAEQEATECMDDWICDAWSVCSADGIQTRTCYLNDYPECHLIMTRPAEQQSCTPEFVPPVASCFDGIMNQGELGIDCGGPCAACPRERAAWLIPLIAILAIAAVVIGFIVFYTKFLKKPSITSPLKKYVKEARSKKIGDARIRQALRRQGWSKTDVDKAM